MPETRPEAGDVAAALSPDDPTTRLFLRHALATLAYRAGKAVREAPAEFGDFRAGPGSRTPREILAHMGDLMVWLLSQLRGVPAFSVAEPLPWEGEIQRFFRALQGVDEHLASGAGIQYEPERFFQGGLADALTHTGQLAMLRHLAGCKMKGESYNRADIRVGRVGFEQSPANPTYEFD